MVCKMAGRIKPVKLPYGVEGFAVLENLYVASKPITEFVREQK